MFHLGERVWRIGEAALAEWYRYRTVACFVTVLKIKFVPALKNNHGRYPVSDLWSLDAFENPPCKAADACYTCRGTKYSRWCGVEVWRMVCHLKCPCHPQGSNKGRC
ncbi:hypothetical protein TNCV_4132301 [Trichonephila clavipes]|nr:hypothetical protein TNCV_4132301 [Trichonephila clavipes]